MTSGRSEVGLDCADWMGSALIQFIASARRSAIELALMRASTGARQHARQQTCSLEAERLLELSLNGDVATLGERLGSRQLDAPAALDDTIVRLEEKWRVREIGFDECLRAVFCLEKAINDVAMRAQGKPAVTHPLGSGLVSLTLGDAHSLGAKVVTQKLGLEGWSTHLLADPATLHDRVRNEFYHFIGISVGHDEALLGLPDTIAEVRDVSRNRDVRVLVGGAVFDMPQDCYGFLGADLVATSADAAVRYLRSDVCARSALHN